MDKNSLPSYYTRGHSNYTLATQQSRTAQSEAAFLLPHIKKTDYILDVGCGPGTITTSLAEHASEGKMIGVDISAEVLQKAKAMAAEANVPTQGPGSVVFEEGNILDKLPYPDDTFDIVFSAHLLGHLPPPELPTRALAEMRRVLKPGGILATRDAAAQHFYPPHLDLDRLWVGNELRASRGGAPERELTGTVMPALFRAAGFDADDGGRVRVGAGAKACADKDTRRWLAWRAAGQLKAGDPFYQSWRDAGITEDEIRETLDAVGRWAETEDAWFVSLQCEMLAWK